MVLLLGSSLFAFGKKDAGTSEAHSSKSARSAARRYAEAFTGVADDIHAIYWNRPASQLEASGMTACTCSGSRT